MIKLFIKVPQIVFAYIILLGASNVYMYRLLDSFLQEYQNAGASATDALYFYGDIRYICIVFFICWFFISFEFSRKLSDSMIKEVFVSLGKRSILPYVSQILVILMAIILFTINIALYAVTAYARLDCPPEIVAQMVKVLIFDVFLLSMASSGMGLLVSCVKRKFAGYAIFLLLILYMIPDYYSILQDTLSNLSALLQGIHSIVCILPQDVTYAYDALYGLPFEYYRLLSMLFWITLGYVAFARVYFVKGRRLKKMVIGVYSLFLLILLIAAASKGSVLRMDDELRDVTSYYAENESKVERVPYQVKKYQMDFKIRKELSAECKMELGGDINQKKYIFTLYHNYKVRHVYDGDGKEMRFEQRGDYITVYVDKPLNCIKMNYSGSGDLFYSNRNACFLPGFFPYYPKAGAVKIYDFDNMVFLSNQDTKAEFDVSVKYSQSLVTNLSKENSRYKGITENLTMISGNYEEIKEGSNTYITLPMQKSSYQLVSEYQKKSIQEQVAKLIEYLDGNPLDEFTQPLLIIIPKSSTFVTLLDSFYTTDSYLMLSEQASAFGVLKARIGAGEYGSLKQIFFDLEPSEDFDIRNYEYKKSYIKKEDYTKTDKLYDTVLERMQTAGVQKTAREIYHYITSEDYKENVDKELAFVQAIK